jgi:hypothetical protein
MGLLRVEPDGFASIMTRHLALVRKQLCWPEWEFCSAVRSKYVVQNRVFDSAKASTTAGCQRESRGFESLRPLISSFMSYVYSERLLIMPGRILVPNVNAANCYFQRFRFL